MIAYVRTLEVFGDNMVRIRDLIQGIVDTDKARE